jgi:type II secretory pathway component PulK
VILFVLSVVLSMIVPQFMVNRRSVDHRHQQLQSLWLARAGIELAVGRLLTSRDARQNETVEVLPGGKVHITIQAEPNRTNTFLVTSEAHYARDDSKVVRSLTQRFRRLVEKDRVRLEVLAAGAEQQEREKLPRPHELAPLPPAKKILTPAGSAGKP